MEIANHFRVGFYVDGCNLYHGIRTSKLREFYWLDLVAFVISGDADLVPPIKGILREIPHKRVFVIHPPNRFSTELRQAAQATFHINAAMLGRNQLADEIRVGDVLLKRPEKWQ